jgi:hypothetical protein
MDALAWRSKLNLNSLTCASRFAIRDMQRCEIHAAFLTSDQDLGRPPGEGLAMGTGGLGPAKSLSVVQIGPLLSGTAPTGRT